MVGVGDNQGWMFPLPSVVGPRHSRCRGPRRLDLLEALCWNPQPLAQFSPPPKQHPPWKADRREGVTEWMSERKKRRGREGGNAEKKEKRGNEKGIWLLWEKKKNKKDIIISKYIACTFQNVFENTSAKFSNYLFIYIPSCSKEVLQHFAARLIFLKLSSDHVTPLLLKKNPNTSSLPVKWSPISLASYLRPSIIWPQTSSPTLSCISSL